MELQVRLSSGIKKSISETSNEIEEILRSNLSRKHWQKYYKQLSLQLSIVTLGLKRSFLWDIGPVNALTDENLSSIVTEINQKQKSHLILVVRNDEFFIMNQKLLPINDIEHTFIDVSKNLSAPKVTNAPKCLIETINQQLQSNSKQNVTVKMSLEDDISCIPCVSGLLIGYPVVYFYEKESNGENCLQDICLSVHQIKYEDIVLMSFSVPVELLEDDSVKSVTNQWKNMMSLLTDVKYENFNKTLDVVIL